MIFAPIDEKEFNKRVRDPAAGLGIGVVKK